MSTAELFVDAVHTATALAHALFWWLLFLGLVSASVVPAVVAGVVRGVKALRRRLSARQSPDPAPAVPEPPRKRHTPSWAREQPQDDGYDRAA